jgi:hypothetical protein
VVDGLEDACKVRGGEAGATPDIRQETWERWMVVGKS